MPPTLAVPTYDLPTFTPGHILRSEDLNILVQTLHDLDRRLRELEERFPRTSDDDTRPTDLHLTPPHVLWHPDGGARYPYRVTADSRSRKGVDVSTKAKVIPLDPNGPVWVENGMLIPRREGTAKVQVSHETFSKEASVTAFVLRPHHFQEARRLYPTEQGSRVTLSFTPPTGTDGSKWSSILFRWKGTEELRFPAGMRQLVASEQRLADEVIAWLRPTGPLGGAAFFVQCPAEKHTVRVLAPTAQLQTNREQEFQGGQGNEFEVLAVVWAGQVTDFEFEGLPIIGVARVPL